MKNERCLHLDTENITKKSMTISTLPIIIIIIIIIIIFTGPHHHCLNLEQPFLSLDFCPSPSPPPLSPPPPPFPSLVSSHTSCSYLVECSNGEGVKGGSWDGVICERCAWRFGGVTCVLLASL